MAEFDDGEVDADLIVAADGIHSAARAQRYPDEGSFLWNGSLLWRGIAEVEPVLDGRSMIWAGHPEQKFVGYPIADLPGGLQRFNFIAELRRPDSDLARTEDWNRAGSLDDFLPQFKGWDFGWLDVPGLVAAAPETFLFPMVDREPIPQWTFGRSTLLGDAAHPMYPIGSNGASQAILDARVLAGCIRRHGDNIDEALWRYEETRRPATAAIVQRQPRFRTRAAHAARRGARARRLRRCRRCHHARRDRRSHRAVPHDCRLLSHRAPARHVPGRGPVPALKAGP